MFYKLNEKEYKMLKDIEKILLTDYEINDLVEIDSLMTMIEDLKYQYNVLEEMFEDYKQNVEDNYKQIPLEEQI